MSIQEHLNKIRNAIKGSEVRESIAKGIETAYDDASEKDNANMEVKIARGTHPNLRSRLDKTTSQLAQTNTRVSQKVGGGKLATANDLDEDLLNFIHDGTGGPISIESVPKNHSVTPDKTTFMKRKNLFNGEYTTGHIDDGVYKIVRDTSRSMIVELIPNTTYTLLKEKVGWLRIGLNDAYPNKDETLSVYVKDDDTPATTYEEDSNYEYYTFTTTQNNNYLIANFSYSSIIEPKVMLVEGDEPEGYVEQGLIFTDKVEFPLGVTEPTIENILKNITVNVKNLIQNGDFSSGLENWRINAGEPYVENGLLYVNSSGNSSQVDKQNIPLVVGHKYYIGLKASMNRHESGLIGFQLTGADAVAYGKSSVTKGVERVSKILTATETNGRLFVGALSGANLDGFVDDVIMIDLTDAFGVGNEPTLDRFENLMRTYDYWFDGEVTRFMNINDLYTESLKNESPPNSDSINEEEAKQAFIEEMNKKAERIGMTNTNYVNPHGLEDLEQTSTARDTVLLGINAMGYNELVQIWNKKRYKFTVGGENSRELTLDTSVKGSALEDHYYIFGGKTGSNPAPTATINLLTVVNAPSDNLFVGAVIGSNTNDRYTPSKQLYDIAKLYMEDGYSGTHDIDAKTGAVALLPKYNPLAYENFDINLLWSKNADQIGYPASVTKVMTAILSLDYIVDINEKFEIKSTDVERGSGSFFSGGDIMTFKDALYCLMLPSSNTAATALSRVIGEKIVRSR